MISQPSTELTFAERIALGVLRTSSTPKGARSIVQELRRQGETMSEASVSRMLSRFDLAGFTEPVERKGRLLTAYGREVAENIHRQNSRSVGLTDALDVTKIDQLIDLLRARRGMESEIVLLAVERASDDDLAKVAAACSEHSKMVDSSDYRCAVANEFHKLLAQSAHSKLFETLSESVLYEALDALDPLLFLITSWRGTVHNAKEEHEMILEALRARDGKRAQTIMHSHLTRLITEVEQFKLADSNGLFESFLTLTATTRQ